MVILLNLSGIARNQKNSVIEVHIMKTQNKPPELQNLLKHIIRYCVRNTDNMYRSSIS